MKNTRRRPVDNVTKLKKRVTLTDAIAASKRLASRVKAANVDPGVLKRVSQVDAEGRKHLQEIEDGKRAARHRLIEAAKRAVNQIN